MNREWFTYTAGPIAPLGVGAGDDWWTDEITIEGFRVNDGDDITHFLLDWWLVTDLYENSVNLQLAPYPAVVGAAFFPEPGGMASWTPNGDSGEALVTAAATWEPRPWTDG